MVAYLSGTSRTLPADMYVTFLTKCGFLMHAWEAFISIFPGCSSPLHDSRLVEFCVDYRKDHGELMVLVSHIQYLNVLLR